MTMTNQIVQRRTWQWMFGLCAFAPMLLGAKGGCETGVVGNDGQGGSNGAATGGASAGGAVTAGAPSGGATGKTCGGLAGLACAQGEYCNYPIEAICGAADQTGTCAKIPEACTMQYAPVCGCNDVTYGNACSAAAAGVSVAANGECAADATECGGTAGLACAKGEYCNYPKDAQCGAADQMGACAAIPEVCDMMYAPVCGCDGKTYGNACSAAAAGVSVITDGACASSPGTGTDCGGMTGKACPTGQYCAYAPEEQCGAADQTGTCAPKPEACTMEYAPVCGCDGTTYGNACSAAAAGVSVVSSGTCAK